MEFMELYSQKVQAGIQTYFFDVRRSKEGVLYLVINESKAAGLDYEHHRIMIFEDNLSDFISGFDKVIDFLGVRQKPKLSSIEKVRQEYPKAYTKWSSDDDESLRIKFDEGLNIADLAQYFQRKPGAIRSRLVKLGLLSYN